MAEVNANLPDTATNRRPNTKERLKSAARILFARNGIEGVTVREILKEAGEKNGASLNYHFGTKEGLIKAIASDIFGLLDKVWGEALTELDARPHPPTVRDLVTVIVEAAAVLDEGQENTSLRLIDRLTQERQHLLVTITAEHGYSSYRMIMKKMGALQQDVPETVMRHRAVFITRYLSTIMAMYEAAQTADEASKRRLVGPVHDLGNVIDTAVGIACAPIVDGGQGASVH